ncbi:MAG: hypothetical protein AAF518_23065 [Spirochaetota bacterium]
MKLILCTAIAYVVLRVLSTRLASFTGQGRQKQEEIDVTNRSKVIKD